MKILFALICVFVALDANAGMLECKLGSDLQGRPISDGALVRWDQDSSQLSVSTKLLDQEVVVELFNEKIVGSRKSSREKCVRKESKVKTPNQISIFQSEQFECELGNNLHLAYLVYASYDFEYRKGSLREYVGDSYPSGFYFSDCVWK